MTLLDRFRAQPGHRHPDPAVRLSHVEEIPLDDRETIAAIAREDEEPRVRRAAVAKLMDPMVLALVARDDPDESVRGAAAGMLRDIALEAFEGLTEGDSVDAVDALADPRLLVHIARSATSDVVALRALSRVHDTHALGSVARHAVSEAARCGALGVLRERGESAEVLAVALNGEHRDTALAAADLVTDRNALEQIALRARNKNAARRARVILRELAERIAPQTVADSPSVADVDDGEPSKGLSAALEEVARAPIEQEVALQGDATGALEHDLLASAETPSRESETRHARLAELVDLVTRAAADPDLPAARKVLAAARPEWTELSTGAGMDSGLSSRFAEAEAHAAARVAEAEEAESRARRDALIRLHHLIERIEPLLAKPDLSLKVASRALRQVRTALSSFSPLPTKQDVEEITRRFKAAQATLVSRVQELRTAEEWQTWANVAVQEQLIAKMDALSALEDPDEIAQQVRALQQQWRQVAKVPHAQADALWRQFKAAHDAVWPRCEMHFAAQAQIRAENMARKTALCERAESLAESTRWIQTAEEIKQLQADWKAIGPVSRGGEKAVWDRFRTACDRFFTRRQADLAERKKTWAENLARKEALAVRAETLADSTEWDLAAAELRRLQAEWKVVGPVKKSRSEAIWQRFHGACNQFFTRYAQRHDTARAEKMAAREAICGELESLAAADPQDTPTGFLPDALLSRVRDLRTQWRLGAAGPGFDTERAGALDERFEAAFGRVLRRWPTAFSGTELDAEGNRQAMELLVKRVEGLAASLSAPADAGANPALSPPTRLAAMLKEALATNTIGGKVDDSAQKRAAAEEVRQAQAAWVRIGIVEEDARRTLSERFHRACRQVLERAEGVGAPGRSDGNGRPRGPVRTRQSSTLGKAGAPGKPV